MLILLKIKTGFFLVFVPLEIMMPKHRLTGWSGIHWRVDNSLKEMFVCW